MVKKKTLLILTFFGVLISVFIAGFIAMIFALDHFENTYIELQLETSKRQAENMAHYLEYEIESGVPQDVVLERLQNSIMGTDVEKGFLCMFDKTDVHLVCHPNQQMIGMQLPNTFRFKEVEAANDVLTTDYIMDTKGGGGIFKTDKGADIAYLQPVEGTNWVLALHQNIALVQAAVAKERSMYLFGSILAGLIIAILATFASRFISRKYEVQIEKQNLQLKQKNAEINQQNEEIQSQKEEIQSQYEVVIEQKEQITSSIKYASRIQGALLPMLKSIENYFPESFVLFLPRDIVSGDFYWFAEKENLAIIVSADCTGHGVPGAFMSMLGIAFFNEIVAKKLDFADKKDISSGQILDELRQKVITSLKQESEDLNSKDGMDLAICIIDKDFKEIQFSGANNGLLHVAKDQMDEYKGDRMPIGTYFGNVKEFSTTTIKYNQGDMFYMSSDGFIDQFGEEKNSKYLKRNFYNFISSIKDKNFSEHKILLKEEFENWKGNSVQLDDVLVVGFKM
ncbi:MAG: SpoIIE family protein phosphatase [Bacteroidales bacterium]|nr:SpoIIE family protein phosphatase [Bacteroidales bacterium]